MEKRNIFKHFITVGSGTLLNMLMGIFTTPVITRMISPDIYGNYAMFSVYANMAFMVCILGLDQAFIRFYYQDSRTEDSRTERKKALLKFCFLLPVLVVIITGILALLIMWLFNVEITYFSLLIFIAYIQILLFNRFCLLQIRLDYKSGLFSLLSILQKVIFIIIVLSAIFVFGDKRHYFILVTALIISTFIPSIIGMLCSWSSWDWHKTPTRFLENRKGILIYGLPFILTNGVTTLFQAADKLVLNFFCSGSEVGIYASTITLVNIFAVIQTSFNTVWGPLAIEHFESNPEDKEFYRDYSNYMVIIMFFLGISLILCKDFFAFILGEKYREAAFILPFLIFNPIMYTISETTSCGINFFKKSNLNLVAPSIACITNFIGNLLLVPLWGGRGAAISTGISYIIFMIIRTAISEKYYKVGYGLRKFLFFVFLLIVYATYNTFHIFDVTNLLIYLFIICGMAICYRKYIVKGIGILFERFIY